MKRHTSYLYHIYTRLNMLFKSTSEKRSLDCILNGEGTPSFLRFNDYSIWRLSGLVGRAADL
jgi:hypothetical protein